MHLVQIGIMTWYGRTFIYLLPLRIVIYTSAAKKELIPISVTTEGQWYVCILHMFRF